MIRKPAPIVVTLAVMVFTATACLAADKTDDSPQAGKPQTTCPVMGGAINKKFFVDVQGKRIYLCCKDCAAMVKKNPDKYIKAMQAKGIVLEQAPAPTGNQQTCPISGKPVDRKCYVDVQGKRVYLCCKDCAAAVKKNPDKYIKAMQAKGIVLEQAPGVLCPKCGEVKGAAKCCKIEGRRKCAKCGLLKGSPGCCKMGAKPGKGKKNCPVGDAGASPAPKATTPGASCTSRGGCPLQPTGGQQPRGQ